MESHAPSWPWTLENTVLVSSPVPSYMRRLGDLQHYLLQQVLVSLGDVASAQFELCIGMAPLASGRQGHIH